MAFDGFDYEALKNARDYASIQEDINSGLEGYIEGINKIKNLQKDLKTAQENLNKLKDQEKLLANAITDEDKEQLKLTKARIHLIKSEMTSIKKTKQYYTEIVKEAKKWDMLGGQILASSVKAAASLSKIPSMIGNVTDKLKDLFEMDKAIRRASLQMGLIGSQSKDFRNNIKLAAADTQKLGMGIKELAEMQAQYSENIGRNVSLGKEGLVALSQIAEGTSLGAEATAQMAADFEAQGVSAVRTKDAMEEAANRSSAMGLNSAKVIKNIAQNTKMLNKFRFKDGVKGLVKMAELSAKLGVDMDFASGFAEKLWNVEGAVETAAQFNVMGGAFARLGDPFKLMYMARNDIAGLTEELANAASESATFNKQTGKFELGAMEMHRLKIIAEQTGLEYDKLATAGMNAAKFAKIKTQVSFTMNDEAKEFLANQAQFDKNGKAYIEINGEKKFLNQLGASGASLIEQQVKEKKTLGERALAAKSFDEQLTNLINMVKTYMMPIVEGITDVLKPFAEDLMGDKATAFKAELKSLGETLGNWAKTAATWFKGLAEIAVAIGPKGIFAAWLAGKGVMALFDIVKWVANGVALAKGFNKFANIGGGGGNSMTDSFTDKALLGKGGKSKMARNLLPKIGKTGTKVALGGLKLASGAASLGAGFLGDYLGGKTSDALGVKQNTGGDIGSMLGAIAGGALGTLIPIPGVGTALGAAAGSYLGKLAGDAIGDSLKIDDGIVQFNKNDKFTKVNDSTMIAGTNKNGNKDLAQVLKYGMMASSPLGLPLLAGGLMSGLIGGNSSSSRSAGSKVEFGELKITGEIKVSLPDGSNIGQELIKSQEFRTSITRVVQSQLEKNNNGGKNSG
jgi:hypothetical protein